MKSIYRPSLIAARAATTLLAGALSVAVLRCGACDTDYERPDMAACPVTEGGVVCSLCCSLNNTCGDQCKKPADGPVDLATPTAERAPVGGS